MISVEIHCVVHCVQCIMFANAGSRTQAFSPRQVSMVMIHNRMYVEMMEVDLIRRVCQGGFLGEGDI